MTRSPPSVRGQAEDHFRVKSLSVQVRTLGASSSSALLTEEWTPLERGVIDHKYYVRGIGTVLEQTVKRRRAQHAGVGEAGLTGRTRRASRPAGMGRRQDYFFFFFPVESKAPTE